MGAAEVVDMAGYDALKASWSSDAKGTANELPTIEAGNVGRWSGVAPKDLEFVVHPFLPRGMVTLLGANGGGGKTLLMQSACTAIAGGTCFLGQPTVCGRTVGVFAEDPEHVLHHRQLRINEHYGLAMEQLDGVFFAQSYFGHDLYLWRDGKPTDRMRFLEDELAKLEDLIFVSLDNVALLYSGDESDRMEVTAFMSCLNGMAARLNVAVLLSTHGSKSQDGTALRALSGSTAWINAARSVLHLEPATEEKGPKLSLIKANHAKTGEEVELRWENALLVEATKPDAMSRRLRAASVDELIFRMVEDGWNCGRPYSGRSQAKDRYLPNVASRRSEFPAKEIERALHGWLLSEHIGYETPKGQRREGLRVLKQRPFSQSDSSDSRSGNPLNLNE